MTLTDVKFEVIDDFDAQAFFSECFGVIVGDGTVAERIKLRVYGKQRYFLRDLPLHHSQRAISCGKDWLDYEYYMRPTNDFCCHLLSLTNSVKVLEPQTLADKICRMAIDTLGQYGYDVPLKDKSKENQ
jgi:hypothetical protein